MRHSLFSNYGGDDVIFMNNWWDFDVLGEIFILLEPFFVWSHLTPHFNQKIATYGGNYIEVHHLENRKCLKIALFCLKCCVRVIYVFFVKKILHKRKNGFTINTQKYRITWWIVLWSNRLINFTKYLLISWNV